MSWWRVFLGRMARRMWFRAALFSLAGVVLALAGRFLAPYLPVGNRNIGQDSVGSILTILASSMLAVTTFSLTAMVQAYSSATTNATPRATQLLVADSTSQNALSTFLGAFLFAIVGIIALSTGFYGDGGRIVLFLGTVVVVAVIAVTLLRWIDHLTGFGRMADVIDRVEAAAARGVESVAAAPNFGGQPAVPIPDGAAALAGVETGYVTHLDVPALERAAREAKLRVHVVALPGSLVHPDRPLLRVEGDLDDAVRERLRRAFKVEHHRTFDSDPRLGAIALAEIASRALSPSVNDPGTAIEVLNALQRVFRAMMKTREVKVSDCKRVFVPTIEIAAMVEDAFRPIARDGAGMIEVGIRLQKTLWSLAQQAGESAPLFAAAASDAQARAEVALTVEADRDLLARTIDGLWAHPAEERPVRER